MYSLYFYLCLLYFLIYFIIKSYLFHTFSNMLLELYCVFSNNFIKSQSLTRIYPILGELRRLFIISFWICMDGLVIVLFSSLKWRFFFSKLTADVKTMGIYEGFSYQLSKKIMDGQKRPFNFTPLMPEISCKDFIWR